MRSGQYAPLEAKHSVSTCGKTYNLVEALRSTQTRGAHANNENINVAVEFAW